VPQNVESNFAIGAYVYTENITGDILVLFRNLYTCGNLVKYLICLTMESFGRYKETTYPLMWTFVIVMLNPFFYPGNRMAVT
jgi:hypothetical protein